MTCFAGGPHLEKRVAIREYLPAEYAMRTPERSVQPLTAGRESGNRWECGQFLQQARTPLSDRKTLQPCLAPVASARGKAGTRELDLQRVRQIMYACGLASAAGFP